LQIHYESIYFYTSNCDPNIELFKAEMQNHANGFTLHMQVLYPAPSNNLPACCYILIHVTARQTDC